MIEAILWSVIWTILVIIAVRVFPFTIEHDYPIEVRKVANVQHPTPKQKIQGILFGLVGVTILFGLLILFALYILGTRNYRFGVFSSICGLYV